MAQESRLSAGGGLSGIALKNIALAAMFIDHLAWALYPDAYYAMPALFMHMIGRITGPTMFYLLAEGYRHTRSARRYTLRLLVFAGLSYLPFIYFRSGGWPTAANWFDLNVVYTLLIGFLALRARHEVKDRALSAVLVALCFILSIPGDWGWRAVLCILLFDYFHGSFARQAAAYAAVVAMQLLPPLSNLVLGTLNGAAAAQMSAYLAQALLYAAMFLPLGLCRLYGGRRGGEGRGGKWFFYAFYPAHLLALGLLRKLL